jgi:hypothetical protein
MHKDHDNFVDAIDKKRRIRLIFSDNNKHLQAKTVVPLDYSPGNRETDKSDFYHFWDFEVGANGTPLILLPEQIQDMDVDKDTFDPTEFVDALGGEQRQWRHFFIKRNWGMK